MKADRPTGASNCPKPEDWARLAVGLQLPERDALLEHAATCPACADRLRDLCDAAAIDAREEHADMPSLPRMAIDSPQARRKLAAAMARNPDSSWQVWRLPLAAMLVAALGVGAWMLTRVTGGPPLHQLTLAYSARRSLELQIPGAAYAPVRIERGAAPRLADLPAALLESEVLIRRHLDSRPDDPAWLHAQGRAALLQWDFDGAIRAFQTAADLGIRSPEFLVDFASAYFERAERLGAALDYAGAVEKLGQALAMQPYYPPALFNRAVVYGKLFQYDPAIADFEEYLRRETDAGWRAEARKRLEELRARRAAVFGKGPAPESLRGELDLEGAMTSGLREFLRGAFPELEETAAAFANRHGDPWLLETVHLPRSPELVRAISALSELARVRVAAGGQYDRLSGEIRFLEASILPAPLRVWRDYELLYRRTRTAAVADCPDTAVLRVAAHPYPWFGAQFALESSLCAAARQDFAGASALVDDAADLARKHTLQATLIRVPNFRGQRLVDTGFCREGMQMAMESLATLEGGGYPLRRAYDFQVIVLKAAAQLGLPNTAYGATTMMAGISESAGTPLFHMIAHSQQAQFALALGRRDEATRAYTAAETAFRYLGGNADARAAWRVTRSGWLELHGDRPGLYAMLKDARGDAHSPKENLYFNRKLIAALCRLELQAGQPSAVVRLGEAFWADAAKVESTDRGGARSYLPEIESVSRCLAAAYVRDGRPEAALAAWQRFVGLRRRLMGDRRPEAARTSVAVGSAVLTIAELNGGAALWLTTSEGTEFSWAAGTYAALMERVRLLRRLASLASVPEEHVAREARRLWATLFPSGLHGATRLAVQASGEWNALPLATFSYAEEGKDVDFSFLPFGGSSTVMPVRPDHVNIVAATTFAHGIGGLPPILSTLDEEMAAVSSAFPERSAWHGEEATARRLESAAMMPGVLHFAGHAIPWAGGIALVVAPDAGDVSADGRAGIWTMARPRQMQADLAVFSACRTGEFDDPGTVWPGQLPEAALLAGANQVVATLWEVDSAATAEWMKRFYHYLAAGQPTPAAIRMAGRDLRSIGGWTHPRYWAGFAGYARGAPEGSVREAGTPGSN